ncbi:MAG: dipeptide epimerase [Alistipes sp.]
MDRKNFSRRRPPADRGIGPFRLRAAARSPHKRPERRSGRLSLAFEPYDLKLIHPFTVAVNTRTHTPDVQVTLEYDGITGYGEASMPPYLGETQESVCRFLGSLDLSQFTDPFRMDEILDYVDRAAPDNRAAKASIDLALHDLVGKLLGQPWYKIGSVARRRPTPRSRSASTRPRSSGKSRGNGSWRDQGQNGRRGRPQLVEVIRSATDKPLCVDANQGWTDKERALETICWLAERNGCSSAAAAQRDDRRDGFSSRAGPLPIITDEFLQRLPDVKRAEGVYDGINIWR